MSDRTCSVDDCPRKARARGWCTAHYQRWRLKGDVSSDQPYREKRPSGTPCSIEGCESPHYCRTWCRPHYERWQHHGDPLAITCMTMDDTARFWSYVSQREPSECWPWLSAATDEGYGMFGLGGKTTGAHRISYELAVAPIPEGLEIDHLCRNPTCVNPKHLEPVTHLENLRRAVTARAELQAT